MLRTADAVRVIHFRLEQLTHASAKRAKKTTHQPVDQLLTSAIMSCATCSALFQPPSRECCTLGQLQLSVDRMNWSSLSKLWVLSSKRKHSRERPVTPYGSRGYETLEKTGRLPSNSHRRTVSASRGKKTHPFTGAAANLSQRVSTVDLHPFQKKHAQAHHPFGRKVEKQNKTVQFSEMLTSSPCPFAQHKCKHAKALNPQGRRERFSRVEISPARASVEQPLPRSEVPVEGHSINVLRRFLVAHHLLRPLDHCSGVGGRGKRCGCNRRCRLSRKKTRHTNQRR